MQTKPFKKCSKTLNINVFCIDVQTETWCREVTNFNAYENADQQNEWPEVRVKVKRLKTTTNLNAYESLFNKPLLISTDTSKILMAGSSELHIWTKFYTTAPKVVNYRDPPEKLGSSLPSFQGQSRSSDLTQIDSHCSGSDLLCSTVFHLIF